MFVGAWPDGGAEQAKILEYPIFTNLQGKF